MDTLKTIIMKNLLAEQEREDREKKSWWPTDSERDIFELYHSWIGTPQTNPITPEDSLGLATRKLFEVALINQLRKAGILVEPEGEQHRVDMVRKTSHGDIHITGYMDGVIKYPEAQPIEVKTAYGRFNATDLEAGKPKTAYLKQLAMYMDFMQVNEGQLFVALFDELRVADIYQFTLIRDGDVFKCNGIEFNLQDVYERFGRIQKENIEPRIEPMPESKYKYALEDINWTEVSKSKITEARMNRAVIGGWACKYSPYKNLWITKEAHECGKTFHEYVGYNEKEINIIKSLTRGYSTK